MMSDYWLLIKEDCMLWMVESDKLSLESESICIKYVDDDILDIKIRFAIIVLCSKIITGL